LALDQGNTNHRRQTSRAPKICGYSAGKLFLVNLVASKFWGGYCIFVNFVHPWSKLRQI